MNLVQRTVLTIVEDQLNRHGSAVRISVDLSDSLGSTDCDSLDTVEICLKLEREYRISISDEEAENFSKITFSEMVDFVQSKAG